MSYTGSGYQLSDPYISGHNCRLSQSRINKVKWVASESEYSYLSPMNPQFQEDTLHPYPLIQVPQSLYTLPRVSSYPSGREYPIEFRERGRKGVLLTSIEERKVELDGADTGRYLGKSSKISHRIRVQGVELYQCDNQVSARRANKTSDPLTLKKIALDVAKTIRKCMKGNPVWKIDMHLTVRFEDLLLLELQNVSEGSWQPVLAVYQADFNMN